MVVAGVTGQVLDPVASRLVPWLVQLEPVIYFQSSSSLHLHRRLPLPLLPSSVLSVRGERRLVRADTRPNCFVPPADLRLRRSQRSSQPEVQPDLPSSLLLPSLCPSPLPLSSPRKLALDEFIVHSCQPLAYLPSCRQHADGLEVCQHLVRVDRLENLGAILSSILENRLCSCWMLIQKLCEVVHLLFDRHPAAFRRLVSRQFLLRDHPAHRRRGRSSWCFLRGDLLLLLPRRDRKRLTEQPSKHHTLT
mmetsp:Transcript_25824/g.58151  ORF Transcript_25824/g.58151 Transcript_25824/m.58151 type:complete len:249 (+) Transcript_25824:1176-1922(+)